MFAVERGFVRSVAKYSRSAKQSATNLISLTQQSLPFLHTWFETEQDIWWCCLILPPPLRENSCGMTLWSNSFLVHCIFRPSATVSRIGLMESCMCCRCRGGPPPPCLAWERDAWLGHSAFTLTKRTCLGFTCSKRPQHWFPPSPHQWTTTMTAEMWPAFFFITFQNYLHNISTCTSPFFFFFSPKPTTKTKNRKLFSTCLNLVTRKNHKSFQSMAQCIQMWKTRSCTPLDEHNWRCEVKCRSLGLSFQNTFSLGKALLKLSSVNPNNVSLCVVTTGCRDNFFIGSGAHL